MNNFLIAIIIIQFIVILILVKFIVSFALGVANKERIGVQTPSKIKSIFEDKVKSLHKETVNNFDDIMKANKEIPPLNENEEFKKNFPSNFVAP